MRKLILKAARVVPNSWKETLLGSPSAPSRIANLVHKALNRLPGDKMVCAECSGALEGYRMHVDWERHRSFVYGTWEPEVVKAIAENVKSGFTAVDAGGHIGYYALVLAKLVGSSGRVFVFEPYPANFEILRKNIELNSCAQVEAVNKALMDRNGQMEIQSETAQGSLPGDFSLAKDASSAQEKVTVETVTLDHFLANREKVDFIQLDVEGAEEAVLRGARTTIEAQHPTLLIEVHHFDGKLENNPVPNQLRSWGYQIRWLDQWQYTSHLLATWPARR